MSVKRKVTVPDGRAGLVGSTWLGPSRRRSARPVGLRCLGENCRLEVAYVGARFDAQVFVELATESLVGAQRIRLPPGSIERHHQLRP